jgi:hypothetical protein
MEDCGLFVTQGARRFCRQACKRFGLSGGLTAWHEGRCWSRASDAGTRPAIKEHDKEPHECDECELVEKKMRHHGNTPPQIGVKWGHCTGF